MAQDIIARGMANAAQQRADAAYDLAKGRTLSFSVENISELIDKFNLASETYAKVGDNIYVQSTNVPDFWVYSVETSPTSYRYKSDKAFIDEVARSGSVQIGYYKISRLETKHLVNYCYRDEATGNWYDDVNKTHLLLPDVDAIYFDKLTGDGYRYDGSTYVKLTNASEEQDRIEADNALGQRITNEIANEKQEREQKDEELAGEINSEAQTREENDQALQAGINTERSDRIAGDAALSEALTTEQTKRKSVDDWIKARIPEEASAENKLADRQWVGGQLYDRLEHIDFVLPASSWVRGSMGVRHRPKITFGPNVSFDEDKLLILRSKDEIYKIFEVHLVDYGNQSSSGNGYIVLDCDYGLKDNPIFPDQDINCTLYIIKFDKVETSVTIGSAVSADAEWLNAL